MRSPLNELLYQSRSILKLIHRFLIYRIHIFFFFFELFSFFTGFGKFHYLILAVSGLIYMNTAIGITILSFVLPAATCDLQMDSTTKGYLSAAPMLGLYN